MKEIVEFAIGCMLNADGHLALQVVWKSEVVEHLPDGGA